MPIAAGETCIRPSDSYDLAMADYNKAIALNPLVYTFYNKRGLLFRKLGRYDEALADYTSAIRLDPAYAWSYNNRGMDLLFNSGLPEWHWLISRKRSNWTGTYRKQSAGKRKRNG